MKFDLTSQAPRAFLAAARLFGVAGAQAASFTGSADREALVKVGMSMDQVRQAIGKPESIEKAATASGPDLVYHVSGAPAGETVFDIAFGADAGRPLARAIGRVCFACGEFAMYPIQCAHGLSADARRPGA